MTTTEEITVSGENFIERRIILIPDQIHLEYSHAKAYARGYRNGWMRGLLMGMAVVGAAVLCVWLTYIFD